MHNSINARIFSLAEEVYIVGGYLRDILCGKETRDIDYVVRGNVREFVARVSDAIGLKPDVGTVVELKKEKMIRIVFKDKTTLDFTELKGDIETNLSERDFTMNALAWSPQTGLIDRFGGIRDIKRGIIRAISIDNFKSDPLRLLRVYRFVSELGWDVDSKTRTMVGQLNKTIKKSADERITLEFFKLLNLDGYRNALKMALKDGLLESLLLISHKKLSDNIKRLSQLESSIKKISGGFKINLERPFSQELTYKGLLRLEQVLKGSTLNKNRLRLSRLIQERLRVVNKLFTIHYSLFTSSKMFDTFFDAKDALFDIIVLTGNLNLLDKAERFKKIWKKGFLTAEEIMDRTGLRGGVELGALICRLKKMQFEGKLKTKRDAVRWVKSLGAF
ncbi:MAG: CCA tRNA nucleotidyltransferase [Nitrospirae bacterium]|nr:CCA tRNA nucleotidyltransferase [Nitrospirota bacterium]